MRGCALAEDLRDGEVSKNASRRYHVGRNRTSLLLLDLCILQFPKMLKEM